MNTEASNSRNYLTILASIIVIASIFVIVAIVLSYICRNDATSIMNQAFDGICATIDYNEDAYNDIVFESQSEMISNADSLQRIISMDPALRFDDLYLNEYCHTHNLYAIHITNKEGYFVSVASAHASHDYILYSQIDSSYKILLSNKNVIMSESVKETELNNELATFRYATLPCLDQSGDIIGILQLIKTVASDDNLLERFNISHVVDMYSFALSGYAIIAKNGKVVSSYNNELNGKQTSEISLMQPTELAYETSFNNSQYVYSYHSYAGYEIVLYMPSSEVYLTRNIALVLIAIASLLVIVLMMSFQQNRLRTATQKATDAMLDAEKANSAKSDFLSRMSHDIRTPVNGIMGMINIAEKNIDKPDILNNCFENIKSSSSHLLELISDILNITKLESGKIVLANDAFNVEDLFNECKGLFSAEMVNKSKNLVFNINNCEGKALMGSPLHIRQIILNLLDNAAKFTQDNGEIRLSFDMQPLDNDKSNLKICVSDNGIGISKAFIPKLFDSFEQENSGSRSSFQGTGLGLSIVKKFIDLMGGTIVVQSEVGVGTAFNITLPLQNATPISSSNDKLDGNADEILKNKKILIAEDNKLNCEVIEFMVSDHNMRYTIVENGKLALDTFKASEINEYDAILMDVLMPEMDGITATRSIRALERIDNNLPIIAMTANAFSDDVQASLNAGMNAHLTKPLDENLLIETLAKYIAHNN